MWWDRRSYGLGYTEATTMENRLKERLTGAAILVALIVLLVPEMFHGQRSDVTVSAGGSGEGPPLRSYTIDLSNGPTRTAPLQSTPPPAASAAPTEAPEPAPPAVSQPINPTPSVESSSGDAPKPAPLSAVVARPATGPRAAAGPWSVQLGLFAQRDNAERLLHAAQAKGFAARVSDRDGKGLYHVLVAGLADRAAAQSLQQRLRDQGIPAAVVAPQSDGVKSPR